jgi:hypothetical protein
MELLKEQIICVQFSFKVGQMATETCRVLREAYSDVLKMEELQQMMMSSLADLLRSGTPVDHMNNVILEIIT